MSIMVRSAEDDFIALKMADAMESAGATVIAITPNGVSLYQSALIQHQRFQVWARVPNVEAIDAVDKAISAALDE